MNWLVNHKNDTTAVTTFIWLQISPMFDLNIFQDHIEPAMRALFYVISWIGGAYYLYYRVRKEKASAKINECKLKILEKQEEND